jgi:hypothetical protein
VIDNSGRARDEATAPNYPPSWDRIYPRCPVCRAEQYALAVLAFSRGEHGCHACGHVIRADARLPAVHEVQVFTQADLDVLDAVAAVRVEDPTDYTGLFDYDE